MQSNNKKLEDKIDTNAWMATYTDLMILLLTFFVLLLSMASIDNQKKRVALNSLVGAFGYKPGGQSILGTPDGINITSGSAPLKPEQIRFELLRNVALKHGLESDLEMSKQLERTVITINNKILFDRHSHELNPEYLGFLKELAETIKDGPQLIELRGYTDSTETAFKEKPFSYSMNLSTKRAMAVLKFFHEECGIPSDIIVAHGFGKNSRGYEGKDSGLNRQVEIILDYTERVPYRLKNADKKDSLLDFNGFLFRTPGEVNE